MHTWEVLNKGEHYFVMRLDYEWIKNCFDSDFMSSHTDVTIEGWKYITQSYDFYTMQVDKEHNILKTMKT